MDAEVRNLRQRAGLTQAQLARRVGTSQSRLSTYETGAVTPSPETMRRIARVAIPLPSEVLDRYRRAVVDLGARRGLHNIRVFGSIAQGTDRPGSDIDLVVTPSAATTLFDLAGFRLEVEELTGCETDVISDRGLPSESPILRDALAL